MGWEFDIFTNREDASHLVFISTLFKLLRVWVLLLELYFLVWVGVFYLGFFWHPEP